MFSNPSILADIRRSVSKDSRRLSKVDFMKIRKEIELELSKIEKLCNTDYDYEKAIAESKEKVEKDEYINRMVKTIDELDTFIKEHK